MPDEAAFLELDLTRERNTERAIDDTTSEDFVEVEFPAEGDDPVMFEFVTERSDEAATDPPTVTSSTTDTPHTPMDSVGN